jgi:hypothetical protein
VSKHFLLLGGGLVLAVLATILVVAWIKGGAQPKRWMEEPVSAPVANG